MRHRILLVDDEQTAVNLYRSVLQDRYRVETASSAEEALPWLQSEDPFTVVLADVFLPGISGIELLAQCAKLSPDTIRIALTGDAGRDTVVDSVNHGNVFRFVSKPIGLAALSDLIETAVQRYESQRVERDLMETTVRMSVNLLLEVLATIDPSSFELSQRIRGSVRLFVRAQRLPNAWELELAASLARIGVVALPAAVTRKVARELPLTPRESELLATVPELGCRLLRQVPRMDRVAQGIRYQAKNYDGGGAPHDGVARTAIPLGARILRIFHDRAELELEGVAGRDAHRAMAARPGAYDPALLEASFSHFPDYMLAAVSAEKEVRFVPAEDLQSEMTLVTEIRTAERVLLVAAGTRLTPLIVQRVQTHVALGNVTGPFGVQLPEAAPAAPAAAGAR